MRKLIIIAVVLVGLTAEGGWVALSDTPVSLYLMAKMDSNFAASVSRGFKTIVTLALSSPLGSASARTVRQARDDDPVVIVLQVGEDNRAAGLYKVVLHELEDGDSQPSGTRQGEILSRFVIRPDAPSFALASRAYDEVNSSTAQTIEMPQTPAVVRLLGLMLPKERTVTARRPKR